MSNVINKIRLSGTDYTLSATTSGGVTSGEVQSMIDESISGKQDTLSAGTGIDITDNVISATGGSITIDPNLDSGSTNAVANSAITTAINSKVDISDNNVSALSGVQLAIAENTYYGDKNIRTFYIKSIGTTKYTDAALCRIHFGNNNSSVEFTLSGSTSGNSWDGYTITAYTINNTRVTHSLTNGVITVTTNDPSYYLHYVENVSKGITIYYTKGDYSSGQTADVLENTVYDVLTELGENLINNNNNIIDTSTFVTTNTTQDITSQKTFLWNNDSNKAIVFKQKYDSAKLGFMCKNSANNELATFEFRPNAYTDSSSVKHPLLYLGHFRNTSTANAGVPQTMVGFRQYDQSGRAAYHYLIPLPAEAKTPFSLTTTYKNYFAPLGFKNGSTMITTDNTGVVDLSSEFSGKVETSAITTSVTSASTDSEIPSAKAVYDTLGNINTILESI